MLPGRREINVGDFGNKVYRINIAGRFTVFCQMAENSFVTWLLARMQVLHNEIRVLKVEQGAMM